MDNEVVLFPYFSRLQQNFTGCVVVELEFFNGEKVIVEVLYLQSQCNLYTEYELNSFFT